MLAAGPSDNYSLIPAFFLTLLILALCLSSVCTEHIRYLIVALVAGGSFLGTMEQEKEDDDRHFVPTGESSSR